MSRPNCRILLCCVLGATVSSFHNGRASPRSISDTMSDFPKTASCRSFLSVPRGGSISNDNRMSALRAVMVDAISSVNDFYMSSPYLAAALTCGTKASAADYVAQRRHYQKRGETEQNFLEKYSCARNVAFLIYGAVYQGVAQEYIYNQLYPVWFGTGSNPVVVLSKVLFNLLVQTTLVTLPIAYLTKAAIFRYSVKEGMRRYKEDIVQNGLLKKYFLLWGPVQCLTFSVVPEHWRVSFIAVFSFFWLIILSSISARPRGQANGVPRGGSRMCDLNDGMTCNTDG